MFPVEQGTASSTIVSNPMNAPTNSQPQQPSEMVPSNQSQSTNQPLTPADMRARQTAQQNAQQQQAAISQVAQSSTSPQDGNTPTGKPTGTGQPNPKANPANNQQSQFQPPGKVVKDDSAFKRASR